MSGVSPEEIVQKRPKLWNKNFIAVFVASFFMSTSYYLLIPTLPLYLVSDLGIDKSTAGIIVSLYVIAALVVRPFSGYMVDRFDRKRLFVLSFIVFVAAYFGYIVAASVAMIVISRIVHGLIWGVITTSSNTIAIDVLASERRSEGIGYFGMSTNVAMAIGPMIGLFIYDSYDFVIISVVAVMIGVIGICAALLIKTEPKVCITKTDTSKNSDVYTIKSTDQKLPEAKAISLDRFVLLKALPLGVNVLLITFSYGVLLSYSAMFGKQIGVQGTGYFFILLAVGIIASRLFSGRMIERGQIDQLSLWSMSLLAVGLCAISFVTTAAPYFAIALLLGLAFGMFIPLTQTMTVNMARHDQRGTATSTYLISFDLGVGAGMMIGGMVAQYWGFGAMFMLCGVLSLVGLVYYYMFAKQSYLRNKLR